MDIEQALRDAQAAAQSAFHDMLDAQAYAMPDHQLTKRYVAAERVVDSLLGYAQDMTEAQRQNGDHHIYPRGVGK
jgi:hypothetical protein